VLVAGMKASTLYHMRGVVQFGDGTQFFAIYRNLFSNDGLIPDRGDSIMRLVSREIAYDLKN
jgi:hypothetical protein